MRKRTRRATKPGKVGTGEPPILADLRWAIIDANKRGLSYGALARAAGCDTCIVGRVVRGTSRPRVDIAARLADARGCTMALTRKRPV